MITMVKKFVLISVAFVAFLVLAAISFLAVRSPDSVPASSIRIEITDARLARGKYLYENLMHCDGCHGQNDYTRFASPVLPGRSGAGNVFPKELGLPGQIVPANITPDKETGIGTWTDGEKIRAIREGISKDGRALFPMMPYSSYKRMSDEDTYALVAYLNNLTPVKNALPKTSINFPVSIMIKSTPQPVSSVPEPNRNDKLKYGQYLVTLGVCKNCHTPEERGKLIEQKSFSGGRMFNMGFARVVSANITKDEPSGIGRWTEKQFLEKFAQYRDYAEKGAPKVSNDDFTLMAYVNYSRLPDEDLGAIYLYLRTQPGIYNAVDSHPDKPRSARF